MNAVRPVLDRCERLRAQMVIECGERCLRGSEFLARVAARQEQLERLGGEPGDRVLVATGRGAQFWIDLVAVCALGLVAVPVDGEADEVSLRGVMAMIDPRAVMGLPAADGLDIVPELEGDDATNPSGRSPIVRDVEEAATAFIILTSGSTGVPKGVQLSHRAVEGNAASTAAVLGIDAHDRVFMAIPFRFVSALSHFLVVIRSGATLIATEDVLFQADYLSAVRAAGANATGGSPVQARWISEAGARDGLDLQWIMSSGDHLPVDVIRRLRSRSSGTRLFTVYGITEVGGRFCILPPDELDEAIGSVGRPIEGLELTVRGDDASPVAPGVEGHVYAEGSFLFDGYFRDTVATDACLSAHGFRTGDLGYRDERGRVYLTGRSDDVFKRAGLKVSTVPITQALMETGAFADVAVVAEDDPVMGKVPHAFYVLKPGGEFDKGAVLRTLRRRVPANHLPAGFTAVSEIPRTGSGKVARRRLEELARSLSGA